MEPVNILLMVMVGFSGLISLLLGYLIKKNQSVEIISMPNVSLEKIKNKAQFSHFAGKRVLMIGYCALLTAFSIGLFPQFLMMTIISFMLSILVISAEFITVSKKHFYKN
jgi:hypothetical protein